MIGERLRELRKSNGVTQEELADVIGVKKSTISLYENNRSDPADEYKIGIAKYFNISLDYLIGVIDHEVCYYNERKFLKFPDEISEEEEKLINEFISFIYHRRTSFA